MKIYEIGTGYTSIPAQVPAATESVVEELTKAFVKNGIDTEIIDVYDKNRAHSDLPITVTVKVPSVFVRSDVSLGVIHKLKRVVYSVALALKIKKLLKKSKEKVVLHFHNQYNLFFFLKLCSKELRKRALIAYTNHNGMWSLPFDDVKDTLHKRYFQEITSMQNSDVIFVLNEKTKRNIKENLGIAEEKIILINNGVNTDIYYPISEADVDSKKQTFGLADKKIILQVGSVNENKGQVRALKMLASLLKENSNVVYAFAGGIVSSEYFDLLKETAKSLGLEKQVVYLGSFSPGEEMNELYNIAYVTVFTSHYEGFPLVCIESLSCGRPVLINKESQLDFGEGCVLYSPDDAVELFREILNMNIDEYQAMCHKSRSNALSNYTWDTISREYNQGFESGFIGK